MASLRAMYSASQEDNITVFCNLEFQDMGLFLNKNI
jgi:hypothetical protein